MVWGLVPSWSKPTETPSFFRMFNARSETVATNRVFSRLLPDRRCVVAFDGFYEWKVDDLGEKQPFFVHRADGAPLLMAALYDRAPLPDKFRDFRNSGGGGGGDHSDSGSGSDGRGGGGGSHTIDSTAAAALDNAEDDDPDPDHLFSFTVLTTDSAPELQWLHDRQPVFLSKESAQRWLDLSEDASELLPIIRKPSATVDNVQLVWHPVSKKMNSIKFKGPGDCRAEVDPEKERVTRAGGGAGIKSFFKPKSAANSTNAAASHNAAAVKDGAAASNAASPSKGTSAAAAKSVLPKKAATPAPTMKSPFDSGRKRAAEHTAASPAASGSDGSAAKRLKGGNEKASEAKAEAAAAAAAPGQPSTAANPDDSVVDMETHAKGGDGGGDGGSSGDAEALAAAVSEQKGARSAAETEHDQISHGDGGSSSGANAEQRGIAVDAFDADDADLAAALAASEATAAAEAQGVASGGVGGDGDADFERQLQEALRRSAEGADDVVPATH